MSVDFEEGAFLGLSKASGPTDIAVVPLAYELTTSYGTGACDGPQACLDASAQVELFDDRLGKDLPADYVISTEPVWDCLLYTSPSPRDKRQSRMPSSA